MNTALLRIEVQEYLALHVHTSLDKFIFKGSPFSDIGIQELAQQLDGKRRVKAKLPLWYDTPGILFPPKLNLEQTSSASTGLYKSKLIDGDTLLDMTGGFGIDSYYFAQEVKQVYHIEKNEVLAAFAKANFKTLKTTSIQTHVGDSIFFLKAYKGIFDTIYVDPARRDDVKGKVFQLSDCVPDISKHLDLLLAKGSHILLKTSPLLDITAGLRVLKHVSAIHIVALKNEVKEVLWQITRDKNEETKVITINKTGDHINRTSCALSTLRNAVASYAAPKQFLYEPNAALLKAGAFNWICEQYNCSKLHQHSHLYTSERLDKFPGRSFKIVETLPFNNKIKQHLNIKKANITTRNFKLTVAVLRKKLNIQEGGDTYLFFTTDCYEKQVVIVCKKNINEAFSK